VRASERNVGYRKVEQPDRHFLLPDLDLLHEVFDDLPLFRVGETGPAIRQRLAFLVDVLAGEGVGVEKVQRCLCLG